MLAELNEGDNNVAILTLLKLAQAPDIRVADLTKEANL